MASSDVSVVLAYGAGIASFASPCVLPLVPAYLSVIAGLDIARRDRAPQPDSVGVKARVEAAVGAGSGAGGAAGTGSGDAGGGGVASTPAPARKAGLAVTRDAALFVLGFGFVFVSLGLTASALGKAFAHAEGTVARVSGVVIFAMAIFLAGSVVLRAPSMYGEWRLHPKLARFGPFAAPVAGAAFAFGWTPCVGPVLGSILVVAAQGSQLSRGLLLLSAYTLGLGTPFLLTAAFFDRARRPLAWLRSRGRAVTLCSATCMAGLGILLALDRLSWVTTQIQRVT